MPFKFNATRRHHIPRAQYRVRNWPAYEAGLRQRGDLTLWIDEAALDGWRAPRRNTPSGQAIYSDLAIEIVLMLRMVFRLALRQAEAFARSVLRLLGLDLCVPDHSTLSRRSGEFARRRPAVLSTDVVESRSQRNRHIQLIADKGRMGWQRETGYGRRSLVETAIGRYKHLIGSKL